MKYPPAMRKAAWLLTVCHGFTPKQVREVFPDVPASTVDDWTRGEYTYGNLVSFG